MNVTLQGKTAVVTGASRGIGAAVVRSLVAHGASVILVARTASQLDALAAELGSTASTAPCDLTDEQAVGRLADLVLERCNGAPDILVNNAGIFRLAPLSKMSTELFVETIQANLVAPFLLIHALLPRMVTRGSGHVITIGSIADRVVIPENGAYSAAKYGLRAMHEVLRSETRGTGIRATLVSPGPTDTPIWDAVRGESHARQLPSQDVMLDPAAVADAVLYVAAQPESVNVDELRLSHS